MARREHMPLPEAGPQSEQLSKKEREGIGWNKETLRQVSEALKKMAQDGFAHMDVPHADDLSPAGVRTDKKGGLSLLMAFPEDTRRILTAAATALTIGAPIYKIMEAGPMYGSEEPTLHEIVTNPETKTFTLPPGTEEFEVRLNGENSNIGEKVEGAKRVMRDGSTIYRVENPSKPTTLTLNVSPTASESVDVGIYTTIATERDLQLLEDVGGEIKFLTGRGQTEQTGLASYGLIESTLGGKEKERGGVVTNAWYVPLNIRLLNNFPQADTAGVGVSAGYVYVDKNTKVSAEAGGVYDPKKGKMLQGREGLVALSLRQGDGRFGVHAELLSTIGSKGKAAGEVGIEYATLPNRGEGYEVTVGAGFGARGAHIDGKAKSGGYLPSDLRYATFPITWRTPYGDVSGGPEIDVDTGEVRLAGGMKIDTGRIMKRGSGIMSGAAEKWKGLTEWADTILGEREKAKKREEENRGLKQKK